MQNVISQQWRKALLMLVAAGIALAGLQVAQAPPADAHPNGIYGSTGHLEVARFFGATNTYKLYGHLAVTANHNADGTHDYQGRVHFHNQVNGASFSGARVNVNVCLQFWGSGIGWQTQASTCLDNLYAAGAWFADSATLLSRPANNSTQPAVEVRTIIKEEQNVRFLHKNDSGTELVDMDSEVSGNAAQA